MKIPEKIKSWSKAAWWFVGAFGVIFGIWGFSIQISQYPSLASSIVNETNVLDINEPLKDLQILFQGSNIREENLNLKVYRVRIENNGGTNITQSDFDQEDSLGIRVGGGRVIETRLVDSNSEYIDSTLSPSIQGTDIVKFNKIILDKGVFFTVELLVLHDKGAPPTLYRVGKVAGIGENEPEILVLKHEEPFWTPFFYGSLLVNLIRFIVYGLIGVAILFGIVYVIIKWQEWQAKRRRAAQNPQPPQQPTG